MHELYNQHHQTATRILAHRQTWFPSNAPNLSPKGKRDGKITLSAEDRNPEARWKDLFSDQRVDIALCDLIDAENVRARNIAKAVDGKNLESAQKLSRKQAPLSLINYLLRLSNLPIEISLRENEEIMASKNGGPPYSVAELSDGERNAILIAATVLTVSAGTLVIIDEPERHLHRSIISPLLSHLFAQRTDCAFVVSTHEVMLPIDNEGAKTLILRGCHYHNKQAASWQADLISPDQEIDDDLKIQILGSRRQMLFVEGDAKSLDKSLYAIIFPDVSIYPKAGCASVINTVRALRENEGLHWLSAYGIIDNDNRGKEEIDSLKEQGIFALPLHSVEAIYYHPLIQWAVASRQAEVTGANVDKLMAAAKAVAINHIKRNSARLSRRVAEQSIREQVFKELPTKETIASGQAITIQLDVPGELAAEQKRIDGLINDRDLVGLIARYPIRETGALREIVNSLGFYTRSQYQDAVKKFLLDNEDAVVSLRGLFEDLSQELVA